MNPVRGFNRILSGDASEVKGNPSHPYDWRPKFQLLIRSGKHHLFADERTERVQASTWTENAAMRRVLEKLGFRVEGVMRAFMPAPEGGRHDYALYAVTRSDWLGRPDQTLR